WTRACAADREIDGSTHHLCERPGAIIAAATNHPPTYGFALSSWARSMLVPTYETRSIYRARQPAESRDQGRAAEITHRAGRVPAQRFRFARIATAEGRRLCSDRNHQSAGNFS